MRIITLISILIALTACNKKETSQDIEELRKAYVGDKENQTVIDLNTLDFKKANSEESDLNQKQ